MDKRYKWDLSHIFLTETDWETAYSEAEKDIGIFSGFKGKLGNREDALALFNESDRVSLAVEKLYVYAYLKLYLNGADEKANVLAQKADALVSAMSVETAFITPELMGLSDAVLDSYISDPAFETERYSLIRTKENKKHVLSESEERIIASYGEVFGGFKKIFGKINDVDFPHPVIKAGGEKTKLTHGTYSKLLQDADRKTRKKAFKTYYKLFADRINTISECYKLNVKKTNITVRLKKYPSALDASLSSSDVPRDVYERLISEVNRSLPLVHEYVWYRKSILGELHMYDMYMPLVEGAELNLGFEDAFSLVKKALSPMGEEYVGRLQAMLDERRIDVYESEGKRSGAFSWGIYGSGPYVLLNYTGTTHDVFTIAHELGHAMHSEYSDESLPYAQAGYSIFVAEVASTTNEVLLLKYLINTTEDKKIKKFLLSYYLDMFRTTIFRQTMFSEFEEYAHNRDASGSLTAEDMSKYYYALNKKYYGKGVVHDREIAMEWARIPHFYTDFYVYKYATGLTTAISFATNILKDPKNRNDYFEKFLRAGGKKSPYEIIKDAGVDLATEEPYKIAFEEFGNALKALKSL